jgi:hypothetical protein
MSGLRVLAILIIALVAISNADILADRVRTVPGLVRLLLGFLTAPNDYCRRAVA